MYKDKKARESKMPLGTSNFGLIRGNDGCRDEMM